MPLHYFIDGYNLIWSSGWFAAANRSGMEERVVGLEQNRERLVEFVEQKLSRGSERNRATIVFDGKPGRTVTRSTAGVRVVFSYDIEADAVIKREVDEGGRGTAAIVVTNDRAIQRWVKGAHAKVISCEEFLALGARPSDRPGKPGSRSGRPAPADASRINEELKRLWKIP